MSINSTIGTGNQLGEQNGTKINFNDKNIELSSINGKSSPSSGGIQSKFDSKSLEERGADFKNKATEMRETAAKR